jgi:hypothetical protein
MLIQTLCQSFAVFIAIRAAKYLRQSYVKIGDPHFVGGGTNLIASDDQFKGIMQQAFETPGKRLPLLGVVAQRNLLDFAQQVHDTLLFSERLDAVIGAEKVGDQYPVEQRAENFLDHRPSSGWSQHVVSQYLACETPDPGRAASDAPAAFVHVEHGGELGRFCQLFINRHEKLGQPLPIQYQTAGGNLKAAKGVKPSADISGGHAESIVQVSRQQREAQSQSGIRQSLGQWRFYFGSTRQAVIFIDHMFRYCRPNRRNILNNPAVSAARFSQACRAAFGTLRESVLDGLVDFVRGGAASTWVSLLAAGFAAMSRTGRLDVCGLHS